MIVLGERQLKRGDHQREARQRKLVCLTHSRQGGFCKLAGQKRDDRQGAQ